MGRLPADYNTYFAKCTTTISITTELCNQITRERCGQQGREVVSYWPNHVFAFLVVVYFLLYVSLYASQAKYS